MSQTPTNIGAAFDWLTIRTIEKVFLLGRRPSRSATSRRQGRSFDVYADPALRADPARVYPMPEAPPRVRRRLERELKSGRIESLRFPSEHVTLDPSGQDRYDRHEENRTVHVRAFLHHEPRPAVLCLHSFMSGRPWMDARTLEVRLLYRRGFDVYLMTLPFHGRRARGQTPIGGALFPSTSVSRTAEGFRQAVSDARQVRALAREAGAPSVGIMGMSLGGYTTSLLAGLDGGWDFAIPIVPMVSMADTIWHHGEGHPERAAIEQRGVTRETLREAFGLHCPLSYPLQLPRERVAIVAGRGDRLFPPEETERLWEHWGRPSLTWFAGGHLLQIGRRPAVTAALEALKV